MNKKPPIGTLLFFLIIFLTSFTVRGQMLTGDVHFWQKADMLGFDAVGDCSFETGDISSVYARTENGKMLIRVTFDDMVVRKDNRVAADNFEGAGLQLEVVVSKQNDGTPVIAKQFDLGTIREEEKDFTMLRTPGNNLWEAEIALDGSHQREELDFSFTVLQGNRVIDRFVSDGGPSDAEGNCAFVHHGNQGLTYTEVFYGSPWGQSGLDGSGYDEVLQVHEASGVPGNFHMSGTLMPAAEWHNPEFNDWLKNLASSGKISMMTSALGQHIMPFVQNNMNDWSVAIENDMVNFRYNYQPRVAWVPERVWLAPGAYPEAGVIDWLGDNWANHGVWGVVLDDGPHLNGYDNRKIHWMNNGSGISLRVIPINNSFVGNVMYNVEAAKNQIASMGHYNICVYGTDWEVAAEMNEHDGTFFLDNYENIIWWCHDNYPGVNVWKLDDAILNADFNGTGAEITTGTYGLLGGHDGYGGSNNSWYTQWASTSSESDFHNPKWNYGYIWNDAYNNLMTAPDNNLSQLGWYTMMINLHETGWHDGGTVAGWEHRYSAHIKNANVYAEAARWAAGQYATPMAAYLSDIDHDGVDEAVMYNQKVFVVFESIGGKANWLFYKDGQGNAWSVVGSDMAYWSETTGDYNESSNNHLAALSDVYPNQQNALYSMDILQSSGDTVKVKFSVWGIDKQVELVPGVNFLDVIYHFFDGDGYIKSGWTPGLLDLLWSGKGNLQRMWGNYGSYCGWRNASSGATVAMILGNGGAQHNGEIEGTLVKGDEIKGHGRFKTRLFAGHTSSPTGTTTIELNTLASLNMDIFPPELNPTAFRIDDHTVELLFSEAVEITSAQNTGNYTFQNFSNTYTVTAAQRQSDWRKVRLTIQEYWVPGDAGEIVVQNIKDLNGNTVAGDNTAAFSIPSGTTPHTIYIDGINDFDASTELMDTDQYSLYITWDYDKLYIGFYDLDLGNDGDLFINIDTDQTAGSGASTGSWGREDFAPDHEIEYQVAVENGNNLVQLNYYENGQWYYPSSNDLESYVGWSQNGLTEIAIPWASLGNPSGIALSVDVTAEDAEVVTAAFPPANPTGNHPTLTSVYAFYPPYVETAMPVAGMEPNRAFVLPNLPPEIDSYLPVQLSLTVEAGNSIDFSVDASDPDGDELFYSWLLDDVETSLTDSYTFLAEENMIGTHEVKIVVSDAVPGNDQPEVSWQVEVLPASNLTAGFTSDATVVCVDGNVQFTDLSVGEITNWYWVFEGGDPAVSTLQNPLVSYAVPGTYDVSLTVSNNRESNTLTEDDYITVNGEVSVEAGDDQAIAAGDTAWLNGTAENYSAVLWTTAGDGSFVNASATATEYIPGAQDITNGFAVLTLTAYPLSPCPLLACDTVTITILPYLQSVQLFNGWSGISSYIIPADPQVENIFAAITATGNLVILQDYNLMYWPAQQINTIDLNGGWNSYSGYQIKVTGDHEVTFSGPEKTSKTLAYNTAGWYLIPVLNECGVAPEVLFQEIIDDVVIVKEIAGTHVFWPGIYQNLFLLESGKAYAAKFGAAVSFNFPECETMKSSAATGEVSGFEIISTDNTPGPSSHTLVFSPEATAGLKAGDRLVIGNTAGDIRIELRIDTPGTALGLQLFGDDPSTAERDGFKEDEPVSVSVLRDNDEHSLYLHYARAWDKEQFHTDGMSLVKSMEMSNGATSSGLSFFPNPATEKLWFNTDGETLDVTVFSVDGNVVTEVTGCKGELDISALTPGLYYMQVRRADETKTFKLVKQ